MRWHRNDVARWTGPEQIADLRAEGETGGGQAKEGYRKEKSEGNSVGLV